MSSGVPIVLSSPAFDEGDPIPARYTCDGHDVSPPLAWSDVPVGTQAFVLVVTDPDAGGFVHWVLTDIPGDLRELPEGQGDVMGAPGRTTWGRARWGGPCPPAGEHRYEFHIYALSRPLTLTGYPSAAEVRSAMSGLVLGEGLLTGVYGRD